MKKQVKTIKEVLSKPQTFKVRRKKKKRKTSQPKLSRRGIGNGAGSSLEREGKRKRKKRKTGTLEMIEKRKKRKSVKVLVDFQVREILSGKKIKPLEKSPGLIANWGKNPKVILRKGGKK